MLRRDGKNKLIKSQKIEFFEKRSFWKEKNEMEINARNHFDVKAFQKSEVKRQKNLDLLNGFTNKFGLHSSNT
jgi:hypothetical protein